MNDQNSNVGQDSFLDIIANLVGILIILVIVVGAQAKSEWGKVEANLEMWDSVENLTKEALQKSDLAVNIKLEHDEIGSKIAQQAGLVQELDQRRHEMLVQISFVKGELEKKKQVTDQATQSRFTAKAHFDMLQKQYFDVKNRINAVESDMASTQLETIEHYPTPIAKTVFADEIHFLLSNKKVAYVPMDELLALMRAEWREKAAKLSGGSQTRELVGPINGFRLQYHLISEVVSVESTRGVQRGKQTRFDHFDLLPISAEIGEGIRRALQDGSDFARRLQRFVPARTTVSIWVHPDSYSELDALKKKLRLRGFQIASWPLQSGKFVSGGPNGFRSSAQ